MAQVWRGWCSSLGIAALAMGWVALASGGCANAQVIPDATLGRENSTVTSTGAVDQITGGATRGANLFHSFQEFSIGEGRGAYFTNPAGIENILSRVTGGAPSNILGTLAVTGGDANLFLLNPNGIVFGPSASLDVGGSFVATTANAIQFSEQGLFSASAANVPLVLSVKPSAFLFNQIAAQPITNQSVAGLQVPDGKSLLLVGGNVALDGGSLLAPGGNVKLGGVAGAGAVGLSFDGSNLSVSFPDEVARADVSLTNGALVDVTAGGGGSIAVNARNLDILRGSSLFAGIGAGSGSINSLGGDIEIDVTGVMTVAGGDSSVFSGVFSDAVGSSGSINLQAGSLFVTNGAQVSAGTFGKGDSGRVSIAVRNTVSFDGDDSGVFSSVEAGGLGNGGDIDLIAGSLSVTNGAQVSAGILGQGDSGRVSIAVRNTASFTDGAIVSVSSLGTGNAGNLSVLARSILLDNQGQLTATSVLTNGGSISLQTEDLQLRHNSQISNIATGGGDGGNIDIDSDTIVALENSDIIFEDLGGNVNITTQGLFFSPDSQVRTRTRSQQVSIPRDLQQPFVVIQPPPNFVTPDQVVAGSCLTRRNVEQGSFTVTGTGGLPRSPYEAISAHYNVTGVQPIQRSAPTSNQPAVVKTATWKRGDPIQEAQGLFVTADGRTIVGTAPQLATIAKAQDLVCSG